MDALSYFRLLLARWRVILGITLAFILGAAAFLIMTPRSYAASTQFFFTTWSSVGTPSLQDANTFVQARIRTYARLVKTPQVLDPVIKNANVSMSTDQLAQVVTVDAPLDTVLLGLTVEDKDPQVALRLADSMSTTVPTVVESLERAKGKFTPVSVTVVTPPSLADGPVYPRPRPVIALSAGAGLLAGLFIAQLLNLNHRQRQLGFRLTPRRANRDASTEQPRPPDDVLEH